MSRLEIEEKRKKLAELKRQREARFGSIGEPITVHAEYVSQGIQTETDHVITYDKAVQVDLVEEEQEPEVEVEDAAPVLVVSEEAPKLQLSSTFRILNRALREPDITECFTRDTADVQDDTATAAGARALCQGNCASSVVTRGVWLLVVSQSHHGSQVHVYNTVTQTVEYILSHDSRLLSCDMLEQKVVASAYNGGLVVWDLSRDDPLPTVIKAARYPVFAMCCVASNDGPIVWLVSTTGAVSSWNLHSLKPQYSPFTIKINILQVDHLKMPSNIGKYDELAVTSICHLDSDPGYFYTGCEDGHIYRVSRFVDKDVVDMDHLYVEHSAPVTKLCTVSATQFASCGMDWKVCLWSTNGLEWSLFKDAPILDIKHRNGLVGFVYGSKLEVYNLKPELVYETTVGTVTSFDFTETGAVVGMLDGNVAELSFSA